MEIIGIGNDIVKNTRLSNIKLIRRFLSEKELEIYNSMKTEKGKIEFLGGRWSSKESIIKASNKNITLSQIEIINCNKGKPEVFINGVL